jgi:hypothetical protein
MDNAMLMEDLALAVLDMEVLTALVIPSLIAQVTELVQQMDLLATVLPTDQETIVKMELLL